MDLKGQGALEYLLMIGAGVGVAAVVMFFIFSGTTDTTCNNYKTSIRTMCSAKPEFECTDHPTIKPGQLGHDPTDPAPLEQCDWVQDPSGTDRCTTNENDPLWDWTDNENGYCASG